MVEVLGNVYKAEGLGRRREEWRWHVERGCGGGPRQCRRGLRAAGTERRNDGGVLSMGTVEVVNNADGG